MPTDTKASSPTRSLDRERLAGLGAPEDAEQAVGDAQPGEPEDGADERRLAAVDVEDLGREQAADAEHRDERQQQRHERDAADVEVEDGAEDVVDERP